MTVPGPSTDASIPERGSIPSDFSPGLDPSRAALGKNLHNVVRPHGADPWQGVNPEEFWAHRLGPDRGKEPSQPRDSRTPNLRRRLYELSDAYRSHADAPRIAKCGHVRHSKAVQVARPEGGKGQLHGLIKCRSKACPVCLARRRADYADQIRKVAELWLEGWEGECPQPDHVHHKTGVRTPRPDITKLARHPFTPGYLATLTIRHGWDDDLKTTGHGVRDAWRALLQTREWRERREALGLEYIVAEEVTHGANGWHPHLHILLLPKRALTSAELRELRVWLYDAWCARVEDAIGWEFRPLREYGTDLRKCSKEDYISKAVGLELADPGNKRGRADGSRTPVQLLQSFADDDDAQALALYQHYERTMRGRRDLTWSKGLREYRIVAQHLLALERQQEAADAELIAEVPGDIWDRWRDAERPHVRMLEACEAAGLDGVLVLIRDELGEWAADVVRQSSERAQRDRNLQKLQASSQLAVETCERGPPDAMPDPRDLLELCDFLGPDRF